jgi:hypothetical protein
METPAIGGRFSYAGSAGSRLIQINVVATGLQHANKGTFAMTIPLALARRRNYSGPAIFSHGFRPFFFAAAVWAALGIVLWLPQFFGEITLPIAMGPLDWHIHEMLYGYVSLQ